MEFYGVHKAGRSAAPVVRQSAPLRQSLGVNAFEWNLEDAGSPWKVDEASVKVAKGFSSIRHYIDWEKLEAQPGSYSFSPTFHGSWYYDAMYERLKTEGIDVLACLKTIPKWMEDTYPVGQRDNENVPAPYGSDLTQPKSYVEQARAGFQYMARYGRLQPEREPRSGESQHDNDLGGHQHGQNRDGTDPLHRMRKRTR